MSYFSAKNPDNKISLHGAWNHPVFTADDTPVPGFVAAVNVVPYDQYPPDGVHDDHEAFYVVKGNGWAKVGDEERRIGPGACFLAPAGVPHAIRKDGQSEDLEIFLCHFPK